MHWIYHRILHRMLWSSHRGKPSLPHTFIIYAIEHLISHFPQPLQGQCHGFVDPVLYDSLQGNITRSMSRLERDQKTPCQALKANILGNKDDIENRFIFFLTMQYLKMCSRSYLCFYLVLRKLWILVFFLSISALEYMVLQYS